MITNHIDIHKRPPPVKQRELDINSNNGTVGQLNIPGEKITLMEDPGGAITEDAACRTAITGSKIDKAIFILFGFRNFLQFINLYFCYIINLFSYSTKKPSLLRGGKTRGPKGICLEPLYTGIERLEGVICDYAMMLESV